MSKLDELNKEFEEEFGWARSIPAGGELESRDVDEIKSFARKYYSLGKLEEREALKKLIRKIGEDSEWPITDLLNELK